MTLALSLAAAVGVGFVLWMAACAKARDAEARHYAEKADLTDRLDAETARRHMAEAQAKDVENALVVALAEVDRLTINAPHVAAVIELPNRSAK